MTVFIEGIFWGLVLMLSTGPSFFYLIKVGIESGFRKGLAFAFGIFLSDIILLSLIYLGLQPLFDNEIFQQVFSLTSSIVIMLTGIGMITKKQKPRIRDVSIEGIEKLRTFIIKGFGVNFFNPFTIILWVGVLGSVSPVSKMEFSQFIGGVLMIIFLADVSKAYLAKLLGKLLTDNAVKRLNKVMGIVFLGIGIYFMYVFYQSFTTGAKIELKIPQREIQTIQQVN